MQLNLIRESKSPHSSPAFMVRKHNEIVFTFLEIWKFLEPIWAIHDCVGTGLGVCFIIYAINCVLVCIRPEMAMDFGFTKWNRCWGEWP